MPEVHVPGCEKTCPAGGGHACLCSGECPRVCGGTYVCARCKRVCGWCFGAADEFYDYCDDCQMWAVVQRLRQARLEVAGTLPAHCVYCGRTAQGNYSIHLTDEMSGPDVPLCDFCGEHEQPSCPEIWDHIKARGLLNLKSARPTSHGTQPVRSYDPNDDSMFDIED